MTLVPDYPPAHHLLRDLRLDVEHRPDGSSVAWLPVVPALLDDHGGVRTGALATLVDVIGGGLAAHAARPDWIATADLTLHLVDDARAGTVRAHAHVLRAGRTTVVLEVTLATEPPDGGAAVTLGAATMTFGVLPRRDGNPVIDGHGSTARSTLALADSAFRGPFIDEVGVRLVERGDGRAVVELHPHDYIRNSLGAVQGGIVATLAESAAREALRDACSAPVIARDLHVTYLALARVGPVRATAVTLAA
ncbi:MAG TPA: PaaI family thioesterase, partial [Acidimicrobiia bacterium]|nr:PaaI family thioesterase [Acidimicrobiia bacterium]